MSKLPKSITLDGRRYPTWALTVKARDHITQIQQVDAHMEMLRARLDHHHRTREFLQIQLRKALETKTEGEGEPRYYWHIVPASWFESSWPVSSASLDLGVLGATDLYQHQDCLLLYVKGKGVIGWGAVQETASGQVLEWRYRALLPATAMPARTLKRFDMRHPTRVSQRIPYEADIAGLLNTMALDVELTSRS